MFYKALNNQTAIDIEAYIRTQRSLIQSSDLVYIPCRLDLFKYSFLHQILQPVTSRSHSRTSVGSFKQNLRQNKTIGHNQVVAPCFGGSTLQTKT